MNIKQLLMVSALVVTMAVPAMAQSNGSTSSVPVITGTTGPTTQGTTHPGINEIKAREENQNDRFQQGVASGAISPQQAAKDKAARQTLNTNLKADAKANGGHLTKKQFIGANRNLNRGSRALYRQKH